MNKRKDNIYIYVWEELNTVYIGRTINPKSRHYAHKHRKSEKTYQFSHEHNVEHPKMIIIENNLTIEEGIEREKYWINYYRENSFCDVLNKTNGGQIGGTLKTYTEEEIKNRRKEYYKENKEKILTYLKEYRELNKDKTKEKNREYSKKYYNLHKKKDKKQFTEEEIKLKRREYYKSHKEEIRLQQKKHRELDKEKTKEKNREYNKRYYMLHKKIINFF